MELYFYKGDELIPLVKMKISLKIGFSNQLYEVFFPMDPIQFTRHQISLKCQFRNLVSREIFISTQENIRNTKQPLRALLWSYYSYLRGITCIAELYTVGTHPSLHIISKVQYAIIVTHMDFFNIKFDWIDHLLGQVCLFWQLIRDKVQFQH